MSSRFPGSSTSTHVTLAWGDRICHHNDPLVLSFSLSFYCWAWLYMSWDIPLVSLYWLSQPLNHSQPTGLWGVWGWRDSRSAVQALFSSGQNTGVLTTLFSHIQDAMQNINSIPTWTNTAHCNCAVNIRDNEGKSEPLLSYLLNLPVSLLCRFSLPPYGQVEAVKSISWPLAGLLFWAGRSSGIWRGIADIQSLRSS